MILTPYDRYKVTPLKWVVSKMKESVFFSWLKLIVFFFECTYYVWLYCTFSCIFLFPFFIPFSSQGLSFQFYSLCSMYNTVQYGIGYCFFSYHLIPLLYRQLRSDNSGTLTMPIFNNIQQGCPALSIQG